jgi:hypothetical protein
MEWKSCGVLDTPLEPVIGLAEGETRWRSMTILVEQRRRCHCERSNPFVLYEVRWIASLHSHDGFTLEPSWLFEN